MITPPSPAPTAGLSSFRCDAARPRVHIVSDVRLLRDGLSSALADDERIMIVGACGLDEARVEIPVRRPDVLLLDVVTRGSLDLPRGLRAVLPTLKTVAFAVAEAEADVIACAEAGVCGYVAQDGSAEDLAAAILRAVGGELICSPRIAAVLFERVAALVDNSFRGSCEPLTRREREIAALVARGLPNKSIARELSLAPATIKNHVHNILQKLSLQSRSELAAFWPRHAAPPAQHSFTSL